MNSILEHFLPRHDTTPGHDPFEVIEALLVRVTQHRGTISLYSIPLFVWFSTRFFSAIRTALNEIFDVSVHAPKRHFVIAYVFGKLRDAGMVVAVLVLLLGNTMLSAGLSVFQARGSLVVAERPYLGFFVTSLGQGLTQLLSFLLAVSLFFVVYKYASIRRLPWRPALLASAITAVLFEVAKRIFSWYLQFALVNSVSVDANIGALILFVIWLYYTALVFLLGGVIAETWDLRMRQRRQEAVLA